MTGKVKKLVLLNLPYLIFVYLFDKLCQGVRLAPGADASEKLLHIGQGFSAAFASLAPSFHLVDLCVGAAGAVLIRLVVYSKGKNAKKYRRGIEYGSARWGTPADIAPYMDKDFSQNVLLIAYIKNKIHKLLHNLPEPYKEVFSLRVLGELSYQDIAKLFGKTESWARVTFHRAKLKIIEQVKEESYE